MVKRVSPVVVALLLVVTAGCGTSSSSASTRRPLPGSAAPGDAFLYSPTAAGIASCAHPGKAIALPSDFPRAFPFPYGTDIDRIGRGAPLLKGQVGIYGFVPSGSFASTVNFFKAQVPRQGFKRLDFEVDSPNDSEGTYQGHGKIGRWQLRSIPGCPHAMTFAASAQSTK